jgi:hypothetical protein
MGRAKQRAGTMVLESAIIFLGFSERRVERLASGREPIKNGVLQALRIIRAATADTFLQLED